MRALRFLPANKNYGEVEPIRLKKVLRESLMMLRDKPSLFLPKLFSAALSSLWLLSFLEGALSLQFYVLSLPAITFIGFFVSVMVADMVRDIERENLLSEGFRTALSSSREVVYGTLLMLGVSFAVFIPFNVGLIYYLVYGSTVLLVLGAIFSIVLVLGSVFVLYFLPIGLLDRGSLMEGLASSRRKALSNSKEVSLLTLLSFLLLGVAFLSQGVLETLGYAGFISGRLFSTVITTYLFVISPKYYLED